MTVVCFLLALTATASAASSSWTELKPSNHPIIYKRVPTAVQYRPSRVPQTEDTHQVIKVLRTAGIVFVVFQALALCYYTLTSNIFHQFNQLDDEEELLVETQPEEDNPTQTLRHKSVETAVEVVELPLADTQAESEREVKKKNQEQSQKYPRANKGHQVDFLEDMDQFLIDRGDRDSQAKTTEDGQEEQNEVSEHEQIISNAPREASDLQSVRRRSKVEAGSPIEKI